MGHGCAKRTIAPSIAPRAFSPKDRQYLRSLRQAEMSLWFAIQQANTTVVAHETKAPGLKGLFPSFPSIDEKRDLVLLLLLGAATLITFFGCIGIGLIR